MPPIKTIVMNKQIYLSATVAGQNKFILNLQKNNWLISDAGFFLATILSQQIILKIN